MQFLAQTIESINQNYINENYKLQQMLNTLEERKSVKPANFTSTTLSKVEEPESCFSSNEDSKPLVSSRKTVSHIAQ